MRIKTEWHNPAHAGDAKQSAGVAALICWRLASAAIANLRKEDYRITDPAQGYAIIAEILYFLVQLADRMAYEKFSPEQRVAFVTALANRLGEILHDNVLDVPGVDRDADYKGQFIARLNQRADDYATFDYTDAKGPDFGFTRYLGLRIMDQLPPQDRSWIVDQIMDIEVPEMMKTVRKAMSELFPGGA